MCGLADSSPVNAAGASPGPSPAPNGIGEFRQLEGKGWNYIYPATLKYHVKLNIRSLKTLSTLAKLSASHSMCDDLTAGHDGRMSPEARARQTQTSPPLLCVFLNMTSRRDPDDVRLENAWLGERKENNVVRRTNLRLIVSFLA